MKVFELTQCARKVQSNYARINASPTFSFSSLLPPSTLTDYQGWEKIDGYLRLCHSNGQKAFQVLLFRNASRLELLSSYLPCYLCSLLSCALKFDFHLCSFPCSFLLIGCFKNDATLLIFCCNLRLNAQSGIHSLLRDLSLPYGSDYDMM